MIYPSWSLSTWLNSSTIYCYFDMIYLNFYYIHQLSEYITLSNDSKFLKLWGDKLFQNYEFIWLKYIYILFSNDKIFSKKSFQNSWLKYELIICNLHYVDEPDYPYVSLPHFGMSYSGFISIFLKILKILIFASLGFILDSCILLSHLDLSLSASLWIVTRYLIDRPGLAHPRV